jgi:hypothetical protein
MLPLSFGRHRRIVIIGAALACAIAGSAAQGQIVRQTAPFQETPEFKPRSEPSLAPVRIAPSPKTAAGRVAFASKLSAAFLANGGYSLKVAALETPSGGDEAKRFPKLLIAGAFDEGFVFRMITAWPFIAPAQQSGFRSVDITSLLDHRHYVYDLSAKAPPRCDLTGRVCTSR